MKLRELVDSLEALQRLSQTKMTAKLAYVISKNLRMVNVEMDAFNAARKGLLERYGTLKPDGLSYDIHDQPGLDREYKELLDIEIEFKPHLIKLDTLDGLELTPGDLAVLFWMIEE